MTVLSGVTSHTCIGRNHESLLQSFQILERVLEMLDRGDSHATIKEAILLLKKTPGPSTLEGIETRDRAFETALKGAIRGN